MIRAEIIFLTPSFCGVLKIKEKELFVSLSIHHFFVVHVYIAVSNTI